MGERAEGWIQSIKGVFGYPPKLIHESDTEIRTAMEMKDKRKPVGSCSPVH